MLKPSDYSVRGSKTLESLVAAQMNTHKSFLSNVSVKQLYFEMYFWIYSKLHIPAHFIPMFTVKNHKLLPSTAQNILKQSSYSITTEL